MKKILLIIVIIFLSKTFSQNIQLHYDYGKDRKHFTSTIEMFKPDGLGATFFFIDFDYNNGGNKSISLAYFEIARYFNIPGLTNISATIQYNDGIAPWGALGHAWLLGGSYNFNLSNGALSFDLMARKDYLSKDIDIQGTLVWFIPMLDGKLIFNGFVDVWSANYWYTNGRKMVILTEPQLWYNLSNQIAIGGEIEISKNFLPMKEDFDFKPTVAVKWTF